jgi:hypothetical protein
MTIYNRVTGVTPNSRSTTNCFTGKHALYFGAALFVGGVALGVVLGGLIGFVAGMIGTPPEPITKTVFVAGLMMKGIKFGAVILALISAVVIVAGRCRCPGLNVGFCICVLWFRFFPFAPLLPVFVYPCPGACAPPPTGLVPPGCP